VCVFEPLPIEGVVLLLVFLRREGLPDFVGLAGKGVSTKAGTANDELKNAMAVWGDANPRGGVVWGLGCIASLLDCADSLGEVGSVPMDFVDPASGATSTDMVVPLETRFGALRLLPPLLPNKSPPEDDSLVPFLFILLPSSSSNPVSA